MKKNRSDRTKRRNRDMRGIVTPHHTREAAEFHRPKLCATRYPLGMTEKGEEGGAGTVRSRGAGKGGAARGQLLA